MLIIKQFPPGGGANEHIKWHIGQDLPVLNNRVISFQADGEELELIIEAMAASAAKE